MGKSSTKKTRLFYIEAIRILAIFLVIFNHTNNRGYTHFTGYEIGSFPYWFCMQFALIAGVNVPLFYMISGIMLIDKEERIRDVWGKRISRYLIVLVVFSFLNYFRQVGYSLENISLKTFFTTVFSSSVIIPYWFLYSYLSFLVGLPFIRKMVRNLETKDFFYLIAVFVVFNGLVSILQYRISDGTVFMNGTFNLYYITCSVVFYPAIGYFFGKKIKDITPKMLAITFGLFLFSVITSSYMTHYKIMLTGDLSEGGVASFFSSTRPLQCIFIFCLFRKLFDNKKIPKPISVVVTSVGGCTFGIYLIEEAIRESHYFWYDKMCLYMNDFLAILIYVLIVIGMGVLVVFPLKLLPGIKKLI